jgi:hypothetical protein
MREDKQITIARLEGQLQVSGMEFDNRLASVRDRLVELVQAEMEGLLASHIRSSLIQQKEGFSCPTFSQPAW